MSFTNDKFLHFTISFLLVTLFLHLFALPIAVLITFAIGIIKEIYDHISPHHAFDLYDIVANVVGIGFSVLFVLIFI